MNQNVRTCFRYIYTIILISLYFCMFSLSAFAEDQEFADIQTRFKKLYINYTVNNDFTVEKISETEIQALAKSASENLKVMNFSHSTSIESFEVLEAYTLKPDGSRIEVPKNNYQVTVNKGNGINDPIFSDRTKVRVVFPDFDVNDSVYFKVKLTEKEPMFPENFSVSKYFWRETAFDDVKINFDLPEWMKVKFSSRDMMESVRTENGRRHIEWTYKNSKPLKNKRKDFSIWSEDSEAGYAISTFMDYESIGKAYGARALPKAIPTERIKVLAKEIVGSEEDKEEQARLVYDWVTTNISYGGNCIGVGAVVPRDTDFILDNKMGDCKDHATLLEALFRARKIESIPALVNAGSQYVLPQIPRVSAVDHVITYIPEWNKFVDSTDSGQPYDSLALLLSDKPIILVKAFKEGLKTPATQIGENFEKTVSTMKVQPDGSVVGNIAIEMKGMSAIEARRSWRYATPKQEQDWLRNVFSSNNKIGSGTIVKEDPKPLLSTFKYEINFERPDYILATGTIGFSPEPLVGTPFNIRHLLSYSNEEIEGYEVFCGNARSVEHLTYEFPEGVKILAKPEDMEVHENNIYFRATYQVEGNKLIIERDMDDRTPGNVCSAENVNKQRKTLMKIANNFKSQVICQF